MVRRGRKLREFEIILRDVETDHLVNRVYQQRGERPVNDAVHVT